MNYCATFFVVKIKKKKIEFSHKEHCTVVYLIMILKKITFLSLLWTFLNKN